MRIEIEVPKELEHMGQDLTDFCTAMVFKLYQNKHKNSVTEYDIPYLMGRLLIECGEVMEQYHVDLRDKNMVMELVDVANFAFLMKLALKLQVDKLDESVSQED